MHLRPSTRATILKDILLAGGSNERNTSQLWTMMQASKDGRLDRQYQQRMLIGSLGRGRP